MITINSNPSAMMAQNNLYTNQANLQNNMLQLSTGLRINSASDDAAGLQISNRMGTQMNGLEVAQRNANDAISMAQTAEGAMTENTTILNRMRDLSLQAANDTNKLEDRQAMQKEVDSLIEEVDRIAETTNFAGISLLDGSKSMENGGMSFQIGSNAGETIEFGIGDMSATALGGAVYSEELDDSFFNFSGADGDESDSLKEDMTVVFAGNEGSADITVDLNAGMTQSEVASVLNQVEGVNAGINESGKIFAAGSGLANYESITSFGADESQSGTTTIDQSETSIKDINITDAQGAQEAIQILDSALAQVDEERANLGAVQNRLESTISNLSNIEENLGVSQSRILDADFAKQTVEMTSNQMLMQAGTSVLAQAKTMPQYATMLL